ncbi:hypothetical protein NC661_17750 [Aquibacillus koreensis]|uniref:Glycosyl-4,4'-diaponeurosporenoate acyltransferase n=1 Tax=Aquibacillus koreensis TaxID=279446 RepID=A0A9X3WQ25_9BACI|nr:hypothetical protein [Aquibacillus koreensis]MCT2534910.1 hypothetical protein [Aquibacillus koreensis]MDC3422196.1 hypothetical protein [Aquibacillus koreensis]
MIQYILEYKWIILVGSEILFWLSFIIFLLLRYWYEAKGQVFFLWFSILNQFVNLPLGAIDYIHFRRITLFHIIIVCIYMYAIFRGPKHMLELDKLIKLYTSRWKNKAPYRGSSMVRASAQTDYFRTYSTVLKRKFVVHGCLWFVMQVYLLVIQCPPTVFIVWTCILIIDGLWSFSYHPISRKYQKSAII